MDPKEGLEDKLDEVKNKDDDDDDVADCKLNDSAEDSCRHGVGIFPADPPDVKLCSAVDKTVAVRQADDQQQSHSHSLCLNKPAIKRYRTSSENEVSLSGEHDNHNR